MRVVIRRAAPEEGSLLKGITVRSRAQWGYDATRFRRWVERLESEQQLPDVESYVAEIDGHPVGWAALKQPVDALCVLEELWVEPDWMGGGVGAQLFRHSVERARELGSSRLEWVAEPGAVGFYEKMGGRSVRDEVSGSFGHRMPVMSLDLDPGISG
jgi:N-acetylglutamate synthase-like GNAT family acetyltransferase